jgi:hypothetical protein
VIFIVLVPFIVLLLCTILLVFFLVWKQFGKVSGFSQLAQMFPSSYKPQGKDFNLSTIAMGSVRYRKCVYITVAGEGLYIKLRSLFPLLPKNPPLLIPWDKIRDGGDSEIYLRKAYRLDVGEPKVVAISIFEDVYREALPHLNKKS